MDNPFFTELLTRLERLERQADIVRFGVVAAVDGPGVRVKLDGEPQASQKPFRRLSSYTPQVGDRVLLLRKGSVKEYAYVIQGKVVE